MSAVDLPNLWVMMSSRPNRIFRFFCLSSCSDNIQIRFSRYSWQSRMPPFSKRSFISSAKCLLVLWIRFLHLPEKGQSLTARDPLVRERCKLSTSKNRPQWDFQNCFPAKRALRPGVIFASLASADALRRLASYSALSDPLPATTDHCQARISDILAIIHPAENGLLLYFFLFKDLVINCGQYSCHCKQ